MLSFRPLNRFAAGIVAILFVACQGMAIASINSPGSPMAGAGAQQAPCHETGVETGTGAGKACPSQCEYQNTASTPAKTVYAIGDLPAITADFNRVAAVPRAAPPAYLLLARIEPPPLRILNCCLRN